MGNTVRRAATEAAGSQAQSNVSAIDQGQAAADQSEPELDDEFEVEDIEDD